MHFKEEKKSNKWIIWIIIIELLLTAAASYVIFFISWERIIGRRTEAIYSGLNDFGTVRITSGIAPAVKKSREQVAEVVDEIVWTTDSVQYRTGPDTTYLSAGILGVYAGVQRTGKTYNEWSQVLINDETYYISSEYLTTDPPIVLDGGQKGEYERYALSQLANYGWDQSEIIPLIKLWNRESGWNPNSHNGSSGAHGIPQALPASKMASEGADYYTNGNTQIRWGLGYIRSRYGSPSNAWNHFSSSGWY